MTLFLVHQPRTKTEMEQTFYTPLAVIFTVAKFRMNVPLSRDLRMMLIKAYGNKLWDLVRRNLTERGGNGNGGRPDASRSWCWSWLLSNQTTTLEDYTSHASFFIVDDHSGLSVKDEVTWDFIQANPQIDWKWYFLSAHPSITWDIIKANPQYAWDPYWVGHNPNIGWECVRDNLEFFAFPANPSYQDLVRLHNISERSSVTWDIIISHPDIPWCWQGISANPNITLNIIKLYPTWKLKLMFPNHPSPGWHWSSVTCNVNVPLEYIQTHPIVPGPGQSGWNFELLSYNRKLTMKFVLENMHRYRADRYAIISRSDREYWSMYALSENLSITLQDIADNIDLDWDWTQISRRRNVTWNDVVEMPQLKWCYTGLSANPNTTLEIVKANIHQPWKWHLLSMNSSVATWENVVNEPDLPWNFEWMSQCTFNKRKRPPGF